MVILSQLTQIHDDVQSRFSYISDADNPYQFNRIEHWLEPAALNDEIHGDCEDFALACRKVCREFGIKSRLVHCNTETGEAHLVLEVEGWIFDCRRSSVVARDDLKYKWNAISGYEAGDQWHWIKGWG